MGQIRHFTNREWHDFATQRPFSTIMTRTIRIVKSPSHEPSNCTHFSTHTFLSFSSYHTPRRPSNVTAWMPKTHELQMRSRKSDFIAYPKEFVPFVRWYCSRTDSNGIWSGKRGRRVPEIISLFRSPFNKGLWSSWRARFFEWIGLVRTKLYYEEELSSFIWEKEGRNCWNWFKRLSLWNKLSGSRFTFSK